MDGNPTPTNEPGSSNLESGASAGLTDVAVGATAVAGSSVVTRKSIVREYLEAIVVAMILAFAIRVFVVQAFKIPSGSMIPTLLIGDHILVSKLSYGLQWPTDCKLQWNFPPVNCYTSTNVMPFGKPQRGDVIVFRFPEDEEKDFIKRIVGTPGDTVQIRNKQIFVNGELLDDRAERKRGEEGEAGDEADLRNVDRAQAPGRIDAIADRTAGERAGADIVPNRIAGETAKRRDAVRHVVATDRVQREQIVEGQREITGGGEQCRQHDRPRRLRQREPPRRPRDGDNRGHGA